MKYTKEQVQDITGLKLEEKYLKGDVDHYRYKNYRFFPCDETGTSMVLPPIPLPIVDNRAGKLLKKGKPFVVVAYDEPYFIEVYRLIRAREREIGRWTSEDEERYQELTEEL